MITHEAVSGQDCTSVICVNIVWCKNNFVCYPCSY